MRYSFINISLMVACFVASAMAVNLQNVQLDGSFKSKQKSIARLKSDVEANEEIDASRKARLLQDIQSIEADFSNWNAVEETCPKTPQKELLSDECEEFYDDAWPKLKVRIKMAFIDFKIAQLDAVKKSGDQRKFVKSCIENIASTDFHLQNYYTGVKLWDLKDEMLEEGYRISYKVASVGPKNPMINVWLDSLGKQCLEEIVKNEPLEYTVGRSSWTRASLYLTDFAMNTFFKVQDDIKSKWFLIPMSKSTFKYCKEINDKGCMTFYTNEARKRNSQAEEGASIGPGDKIVVLTTNPISFSYFLNGKEVYRCEKKDSSDVNFLSIEDLNSRIRPYRFDADEQSTPMSCSCIDGEFKRTNDYSYNKHCEGKIYVSDEEMKRGLLGTMIWNEQSKPKMKKQEKNNCDNPNLTSKERKKCLVKEKHK